MHRPACHPGAKIQAVKAYVANAETELILRGKQFIDCTGDALPAHLAGCEWRWGSESTAETGEIHAPADASTDTMGNSIHIRCIDTGRPAPYRAPDWAMKYEDSAFFYEQGRRPNDPEGGFWWIEIGVPWNTVYDNETIRHELTRHALGVWDWMKNRDEKMMERCKNYALEFIGQVPGKRESRRVIGRHFLDENELQRREVFADEAAYGGWFIDLHTPGGLLAPTSEPASASGYNDQLKEIALKYIGPYGIPLRSLISKDVDNLMMAGRNISTTHAALGTVRVMATCGLMGQAVGAAAALAVSRGLSPSEIAESEMEHVQQQLLRDGCFLPNVHNRDPADLARKATASASSTWAFSGLGAWEAAEDTGLRPEWLKCGREIPVSKHLCQWLYLSGPALERIGLWLHNSADETASLEMCLRPVDSLWDYEIEIREPIWRGKVEVPGGQDGLQWIPVGAGDLGEGCYRVEIRGDNPEADNVAWRLSGNLAYGWVGGHVVGSGRFHWNRTPTPFAMQFDPPQSVYDPSQVLGGATRPTGKTNLWFSDPGRTLPQSLDLTWESDVELKRVEITFPGQIFVEVHAESPFYVAPHIARKYRIQSREGEGWRDVLVESDNLEQRRQHELPESIRTRQLRILIEETHGARRAGLAEVRCY